MAARKRCFINPVVQQFPRVWHGAEQWPGRARQRVRPVHGLPVNGIAESEFGGIKITGPVVVHKQLRIDASIKRPVCCQFLVWTENMRRSGVADGAQVLIIHGPVEVEQAFVQYDVASVYLAVFAGGAGRPGVVHRKGMMRTRPFDQIARNIKRAVRMNAHQIVLPIEADDAGVGHAGQYRIGRCDGGLHRRDDKYD